MREAKYQKGSITARGGWLLPQDPHTSVPGTGLAVPWCHLATPGGSEGFVH